MKYDLYKSIYGSNGDINRFRKVGLWKDGMHALDNPDTRFFKILFYFENNTPDDNYAWEYYNGGNIGLLAPTWNEIGTSKDFYKYNSAWAYLKNNFEDERADVLKEFITLLAQISSESPWYFKSISGVGDALSREKWGVTDERKKISINCLADPVDHRIESLLSMYRSIVWSHTRKCEVIPANLRKFDMGLFVFSSLINGVNKYDDVYGDVDNGLGYDADVTYKYIEFHNCEISIDSIKSGYDNMSNDEGVQQEFTIDIYFDDCYENEYNQFILKAFGDMFLWDAWTNLGWDDNGNILDGNKKSSTSTSVDSSNDSPDININVVTGNSLYNESELSRSLQTGDDSSSRSPRTENTTSTRSLRTGNNLFERIRNNISNSLESALRGGLGNIYGAGYGITAGRADIERELNRQVSTLTNKVVGNINDSAVKLMKAATSTITKPVLGTLKTAGNFASNLVDAAQDVVVKPVLGTVKAAETATVRGAQVGQSYIDEASQYISNGASEIGNIAYDTQVKLAMNVGKNRLNRDLGNKNNANTIKNNI